MAPLLQVRGLKNYFPILSPLLKRRVGYIRAVDDVSFQLDSKKTLAIVGESGCGKTTIGKTILQILRPTEGEVIFQNENIVDLNTNELKRVHKTMQMIFQDPYSSLNPKHRINTILKEPLSTHMPHLNKDEVKERISEILKAVSLNENDLRKYPHEFSGGQRQRIAIARTLILKPKLIIADEPVSALDVSVQAQIINLIKRLQEEFETSFIFISHDLSVVQHIAEDVIVMYLGKIVEKGSKKQIFSNPLHPYTQRLIESIPIADTNRKRKKIAIQGETPSPRNPPSGCYFQTRCPFATDQCRTIQPILTKQSPDHFVACHLVENKTE